jgi:hypothetical protein
MFELLEPISVWTGIPESWVLGILGVAVLLFLRWGLRHPWGMLRVMIVVALLAGAAYAAFELTKSGTVGKKALIRMEESE